jgi:hypothetical protein
MYEHPQKQRHVGIPTGEQTSSRKKVLFYLKAKKGKKRKKEFHARHRKRGHEKHRTRITVAPTQFHRQQMQGPEVCYFTSEGDAERSRHRSSSLSWFSWDLCLFQGFFVVLGGCCCQSC